MFKFTNKTGYTKVLEIARPWMAWLLLAGVSSIFVALLEQLVPLQVRTIVNIAFEGNGSLPWSKMTVLFILLGITQLMKISQRLVTEWAATRLSAILYQEGVHHLLSYPIVHFNQNHSGALQVRLERSTQAVTDLLKTGLGDILTPVVSAVIAIGILLHTNLLIGLTTATVIPLLIGLTIWQANNQKGIRVDINHAREQQGVHVAEAVLGIEQVKLFRAETIEAHNAGSISGWLAKKEYTHHVYMAAFDLAKFWIERLSFGVILMMCLQQALSSANGMGVGDVMMTLLLFDRVAEPARHLHRLIDESTERWDLARNYFQILDVSVVKPPKRKAEERSLYSCDVSFDHVTFAYNPESLPVIDNISIQIPGGTHVALIGKSGAGKSTFGKLLTGLYVPDAGTITVDGQEVEPIEKSQCSKRVGMLSQEVHIFAGTISENILYGNAHVGPEKMREAAEIAGISGYIESLVDGYETLLGQRGAGLSGGQKQRLALARLILQDPDVIVFDEPSSALDPENARRFFQNVLRVCKLKTLFVITHDTQNLDWANQVIRFEDGRIAQNMPSGV